MGRKKLIVISMDALVFEDLAYLRQKPTFAWLLDNGSMVQRMKPVYPSLTYPCHTAMATGCFPDKHGIVNNQFDIVGQENPNWIFDHKYVKCPDIFDALSSGGFTTASVGWPVTGNHPNIHYLIDECWPEFSTENMEDYCNSYRQMGSSEEIVTEILAPMIHLRAGRKHPEVSYFNTRGACELIRRYKPDFLTLHVGNIDSYRHKTGVFSQKVIQALDDSESILRWVVESTKDAGIFEEVNFVVTADHGHLNTTRTVHINTLFRENGLVTVDTRGEVTDCKAWCFATGMSAQVKVYDAVAYEQVSELLYRAMETGLWGISKVYTRKQAEEEERLSGDFDFWLETDGATSFGNRWMGENCVPNGNLGDACLQGNHGYHPDKAPRPPFIACGPDIKQGVVISDAHIVDGAPTYAKLMGVELPGADGRALEELIKEV